VATAGKVRENLEKSLDLMEAEKVREKSGNFEKY
jgi:hypothetical protein